MGHKLQMYENLRDMLEREVSAIEHKQDINEQSLDNLYKLTAALKVVDKCIERETMEQGQMQGGNSFIGNRNVYSRDGMSNQGGMSGQGSNQSGNMSGQGMSNEGGMSQQGMSNTYPMRMPMPMPIYYRDAPMMTAGTSSEGMSDDYSRNMSNEGGMSGEYSRGNSYARRGRDGDSDGRYNESSNGQSYGYSRDASRKKMVQKLETLMDDTMSENERTAIQDCINRIK